MKRLLKTGLTALLLTNLCGCASNISTWKEELPNRVDNLSSNTRQELYDKFAIKKVNLWTIQYDTFKIGVDDTEYYWGSFIPTVAKVSPSFEDYLQQYLDLGLTREWSSALLLGISLVPIFIASLSTEYDQNTRYSLYGSSLIGLFITGGIDFVLMLQQEGQLKQIQKQYNADLAKYLELESSALDSHLPTPALNLVGMNELP